MPVSKLLFKNIAGRCGRAGMFTEGDTIIYDNTQGSVEYTSDNARHRLQIELISSERQQALGSGLGNIGGATPANAKFGALASQYLAAIPENADVDDLASAFANESFAASIASNSAPTKEEVDAVVRSLLDPSEGALAEVNSPIALTIFGLGANKTGFSPHSCRQIRSFVTSYLAGNMFPGLEDFSVKALSALNRLPEQTNSYLHDRLASASFYVKRDDLPQVITAWLSGQPLDKIFTALPSVRSSTSKPDIAAWLSGLSEPCRWDSEFEKFVEFVQSVFENYLPWVIWSSEYLNLDLPDANIEVNWAYWSQQMEYGVDNAWAVAARSEGAPAGRNVVRMVGLDWPDDLQSHDDPLGLRFMHDPSAVIRVAQLFETCRTTAAFDEGITEEFQRLFAWLISRSNAARAKQND